MDDEADAVLSDVEGEDPVPIASPAGDEEEEEDGGISGEVYRKLVAELERERAAREAAEAAKLDIQASFHKLKALAHEAIKKRDEAGREKDEAFRRRDEAAREKDEAFRRRDEAAREKDEVLRQLEEAVRDREGLRSEIENSRHMLVSGIEKISGKVSSFKNFAAAGGLPRSQKYVGLPATAYGVIKRTNEIVEEMIRQVDSAAKLRNEVREQMDQRNYEIAIEVSQLEATISGLRDEVEEKGRRLEEVEREVEEKGRVVEREGEEMRELVREYDDRVKGLESRMDSLRGLLVDQLSFVGKIHDRLYEVIKIVDANHSDSELSESLFLAQETDVEENIRASLAGLESIHELTRIVVEKTKDVVEEKSREIRNLNETVGRLVKEKEQVGSLLRSALSKRMMSDPAPKRNEMFQAAENGLREVGLDFKFNKVPAAGEQGGVLDGQDDEIYSLADALENIVKASQLEIIELRHSVEELRAESRLLKEHTEAQAKELNNRMLKIQDLEEKERVANENVEGLMMDIAAAEEEITRWKLAAEQEAAAGGAVEKELFAELSTLRRELEEMRQAMLESEKKLTFKEETAAAAMAAREAAERSLALADMRASRLRDRVEELSRQLEELETREDTRGRNRPRYVCWPWQWLGIDFVGTRNSETQEPQSNEMELSEPLL